LYGIDLIAAGKGIMAKLGGLKKNGEDVYTRLEVAQISSMSWVMDMIF
jgi:hypothetical protein